MPVSTAAFLRDENGYTSLAPDPDESKAIFFATAESGVSILFLPLAIFTMY
jgi:hypothetical protein